MKPLGALFFVAVAAFALGWGLGHRTAEIPPAAEIPAESPREEEAQRLLNEAAKDLNATVDSAERQRKADELLEKIFKLFLIEVTLRLREPKAPPAPSTTPSPPPRVVAEPRPLPTTSPSPAPALEKSGREKARRRARIEIRVIDANNPSALKRALTELAGQDFNSGYGASKELTAEQERAMIGVWEGRIEHDDGKPSWSLRIEVSPSPRSTPEKALYKSEIVIRKGGNSVSRTSGEGSLKNFSANTDGSNALYIECGGDVLELYFSRSFDGMVGLYYEAQARAKFTPTGRVRLERRGS